MSAHGRGEIHTSSGYYNASNHHSPIGGGRIEWDRSDDYSIRVYLASLDEGTRYRRLVSIFKQHARPEDMNGYLNYLRTLEAQGTGGYSGHQRRY